MNTLRPPESFWCHWLIKSLPPLCPLRREVSEEGGGAGGGNKTKTFCIRRWCCFKGWTAQQPHGAVFSVKLLVSFCFCLIKNTGNLVERERYPQKNPQRLDERISQSSSKAELMWHPLNWLQHILIQIGANYPRIPPRECHFTTPWLAQGQLSADHIQLRAVDVQLDWIL